MHLLYNLACIEKLAILLYITGLAHVGSSDFGGPLKLGTAQSTMSPPDFSLIEMIHVW